MNDTAIIFGPDALAEKRVMIASSEVFAEEITVSTQADVDTVGEMIKITLDEIEALETMRTSATRPLNASLRQINDWFREPLAGLERIKKTLKNKLAEYLAAQQREQKSAFSEAANALQEGRVDAMCTALARSNECAQTAPPKGAILKESWDFEVVCPDAVPRNLCSPDYALILRALKEHSVSGPTPEIPGLRIWVTATAVVRRSK